MPMIDVYAATGTFPDTHALARDLAAAVMAVEQVPDIPMPNSSPAGFVTLSSYPSWRRILVWRP